MQVVEVSRLGRGNGSGAGDRLCGAGDYAACSGRHSGPHPGRLFVAQHRSHRPQCAGPSRRCIFNTASDCTGLRLPLQHPPVSPCPALSFSTHFCSERFSQVAWSLRMTHTSPAVSKSFLGSLQTNSDASMAPEVLLHACVQADAGAEGLFLQALEHCPALVSCFLHGKQLLTCSFSPKHHFYFAIMPLWQQ